ncbi:MAG: tetratricopeptide repeat protein [Candidatus Eiseniibacteriota bacterium]
MSREDPARWERIQSLIEQALERPESGRRSFLETACGRERDLFDEVISLLEAPVVDELPTSWLNALADTEPARFVPGDRIADRYLVQALLGRGGMGEVYEARDEALGITVALKTLRHADDKDESLERLRLEGLLARAVWHPNVCRVYDLDRHGEADEAVWFLTMERLHGATLSDRLRVEGRIPPDRALHLAQQMAAGLGAAHQAGVVHRDFKPGNIMLVDPDGSEPAETAVVTDFGTARWTARVERTDSEGGPAPIIGTPAYMAPEQVRGEEVGPAADIYALGVVLHEMVTGTLPPGTTGQRHDRAPSTLDERWDAVIRRCLAPDPRRRFRRAEDVAEALNGRRPATPVEAVEHIPDSRRSLPAERDPFVGREADLETLESSLAADSRLVTLLGPGGMGKTRLAVRHGWKGHGAWPGGVWFCDLTDARDVHGILSAVAGALAIPIGRGDAIGQLGHAIAGRGRCLLILDNFERVTSHAAETLGRWLEQAPDARFVVTSRERLNLNLERVQPVEPLAEETGVELFRTRARGLRPAHELVGGEAEAAREIVRLVEGMPLAIELAASRMRVMSALEIASQMRNRFQLLTGGRSARHETLAGAIDGSWEPLTPVEQAAWSQCSIFEGGFTLEAAQAVLDLRPWEEARGVLDVLQSLVDKSLLRTWVPGAGPGEALPEVRFGMYVSLQEYARTRLGERESGVQRLAEERHGAWCARFGANEAIDALDRHGGTARRRRAEREVENLTAACRRALARGDARTAVPTYRATVEVLALRGPFDAAIQLGREVLSGLTLDRADKADVLWALGMSERLSGRMDEALPHWEEALEIARAEGARRIEGMVLGSLGILHAERAHLDDARAHFEAALAIHQELGDRRLEGVFTGYLGTVALDQSRIEESRGRMEAALAIHREVGNRRFEGVILSNLAILLREQGQLEEAVRHNELALEIHRETGDRRAQGVALGQVGNVRVDQGRIEEGRQHCEAALAIFRDVGARRFEATYLSSLGNIALLTGRLEEGRPLLEAALAIHREIGDLRGEGIALGTIGDLLHRQGRNDEARDALTRAEEILREIDTPAEVANVLCTRVFLELRNGDPTAARATLDEARAIAVQVGAGPDSELGQKLVQIDSALSNAGPATPARAVP